MRVVKTVGGVTTWYLYDLSGNLIGEYDSNGVMIAEHLYGPSGRIVTIRKELRPVAINLSDPPMILQSAINYAGAFGLWDSYAFAAVAGRRAS